MISLDRYNGALNKAISEFSCLNKDIPNLPTNRGDHKADVKIINGSLAVVMDTSRVFMFDEENDKWHELK